MKRKISHQDKKESGQTGFRPNRLLGQHFLADRRILRKIVTTAALSPQDTVLEIGPGLGSLTQELTECGCQVMAVEKDSKLTEILKEKFKNTSNLQIIKGDILKLLEKNITKQWGSYKVVANIPYYLTAVLVRRLLESTNPPQLMVLMVQKEVAQRICAQPPRMSLLAVAVQFYAEPKIISYVSKNSFWPKPKVDSAIIKITPHNSPFYKRPHPELDSGGAGVDKFFRVLKAGFSQPRKQLVNNLSRGLKIERAEIEKNLKTLNIEPPQRPQTLSVQDWIGLWKKIKP